MASLFKVKALYDFEAKEEDDLGFPAGQIIDVTEEVDDNWLEGKYNDVTGASKSGIFPREFVDKYEPEVPTRPSRPTRPKQDSTAPAPTPAAVSLPAEPERDEPDVPIISRPQPSAVDVPPAASREEQTISPPSAASNPKSPPPAPKPAPAAPVDTAEPPASGKKPPPPIAAKSNAFRDRIAAFNQPAAAPIAPMVPGQKPAGNTFIKKPFVAPPPLSNSYVPPPKAEPVHKPYIREEDPEIRRRLEEDRAAAESAGLTGDNAQEEDEDAPKPTSLKERIARLQQQQMEQAQRRAEGGSKEKKKVPPRKPSEPSELHDEAGGEEMQRERSADTERQSLDVSREKPRVPSTQRRPPEPPMSPVPAAPDHELVSDGNEADHSAAGETTEDDAGTIGPEDSDETEAPAPPRRASTAPKKQPNVGDEEDTAEEAEEDEDSMDEETRRRLELRERMAKMSGGMGMAGMFGPPGGMPMPGSAPPKKRSTKERKASEDAEQAPTSPSQPAPRIPMVPVPGMNRVQSPEADRRLAPSESQSTMEESVEGAEDEVPMPPSRKSTHEERAPPPVPKDSRPSGAPPIPGATPSAPRPPPPESRPVPPPPPSGPISPGPGSESDDEASMHPPKSSADESGIDTPGPLPVRSASGAAPPIPTSGSVQSPENKRSSYFGSEPMSATSDKRASRVPPPVPGSPLTSPRPPPPPPPTAIPSRSATTHEADEEQGESDYEGDYDTDIASSAKHKDALKAHVREPSLDDSTTADEAPMSPPAPPPHATAPRAVPPPPPLSQPPKSRPSMDSPRAPPPVPPVASPQVGDEDYDPYRYDHASQRGPPPPVPVSVPFVAPPIPPRDPEQRQESSVDDLYSTSAPKKSMDAPSRPMPPPPNEAPPPRAAPRQSLDVQRSNTTTRRSMDQPRPSGEYNGQIAQDITLNKDTPWWTAPHALPPVLQTRNGVDILSESEESTTSKRGGRTTISKDIYVLYIDYSQTIITAQYDPTSPTEVILEQKHLPPPPKLRQDQLETYWQRFGQKISEKANAMGHSKKDTVVGDGSPTAFVSELIKSQGAALQPVGTRAYGSLVYANLANASTMQYDEIRAGDVVTLRNARFEGSHGAMKHKYKVDYGVSHVAIVEEWDGTRRAIRGWEQGREKKDKGVRSEKFRLGDLRSGEVKVWRIVGRDWVEWESGS